MLISAAGARNSTRGLRPGPSSSLRFTSCVPSNSPGPSYRFFMCPHIVLFQPGGGGPSPHKHPHLQAVLLLVFPSDLQPLCHLPPTTCNSLSIPLGRPCQVNQDQIPPRPSSLGLHLTRPPTAISPFLSCPCLTFGDQLTTHSHLLTFSVFGLPIEP